MLFNSLDFAVFLPIVLVLYWFVASKNYKHQNIVLLAASYIFYGFWDWRFLFLIIFSTVLDYFLGLKLSKETKKNTRQACLLISILINLGFLGFFKYYNFFIENFITAFSFFGQNIQPNSLNIILPVGISFYTFQTLSYTIDVYRKKLEPTQNFIAFSVFVSFFPQLVAGPIERAKQLLPQFYVKKTFKSEQAKEGLHLIIWGLFKKVVIADSCAIYVNEIFSNYETLNSITLLLGAVYFAFQIYCDFSGYSDIAIGSSKLFGVDLMRNFNYPYFSRNVAEFWRRWHISLSTWFRDYLYIPLGGSKVPKWINIRNVFIVFLVSGFWHGANWTFIAWGALHVIYFLPLLLTNRNRKYLNAIKNDKFLPSFKDFIAIITTFLLITFGWIFFRANSITEAFLYIENIFKFKVKGGFQYLAIERYAPELMLLITGFVVLEWSIKKRDHPFYGKGIGLKLTFILLATILLGHFSNVNDFIYFQF